MSLRAMLSALTKGRVDGNAAIQMIERTCQLPLLVGSKCLSWGPRCSFAQGPAIAELYWWLMSPGGNGQGARFLKFDAAHPPSRYIVSELRGIGVPRPPRISS